MDYWTVVQIKDVHYDLIVEVELFIAFQAESESSQGCSGYLASMTFLGDLLQDRFVNEVLWVCVL